MDRIADRWSGMVIIALSGGSLRFAELRAILSGVSEKMLTQTLRGMERDGLVVRHDHTTWPRRVDYTLTELGRSLVEPLTTVCAWSDKHLDDVKAARERYDNA
jgi:DNA-binding HxlR family transcriptional regulator